MISKSLFHNVIIPLMFNIISRNLLIKTQTLTDKYCNLDIMVVLQSATVVAKAVDGKLY